MFSPMSDLFVYRRASGLFDAWRRYELYLDSEDGGCLACGQIRQIEFEGSCTLAVFGPIGDAAEVQLDPDFDAYLVVSRVSRPTSGPRFAMAEPMSRHTFEESVQRFDGPPYVGGTRVGLLTAIAASLLFVLAALGSLVGIMVRWSSQPDFANHVVLLALGLGFALMAGFIGISGLRGLAYYFRYPHQFRH
jgi:hypothetical protein